MAKWRKQMAKTKANTKANTKAEELPVPVIPAEVVAVKAPMENDSIAQISDQLAKHFNAEIVDERDGIVTLRTSDGKQASVNTKQGFDAARSAVNSLGTLK